MYYYYITGTSRGIGKEIAEQLLGNDDNKVIGISRKNAIKHSNYSHIYLNLSDSESVSKFVFQELPDAKKVVLINNAGILGEVGHIGSISADTIKEIYQVNVIALGILCNAFVRTYQNVLCQKSILNISSGAGKYPIDGWSAYCASKAAVDMFSKVIHEEQQLIQDGSKRIAIFSVAPGKVDTNMQAEIRKAKSCDFSKVQFFIDAKKEGELLAPDFVARKYIELIESQMDVNQVVFSLKDFSDGM